jgi:hypothetical protein
MPNLIRQNYSYYLSLLLRYLALPSSSVRLSLRLLPTLITISSSSIDSPVTHARLAYSLPYTWAILPHIQTDPTPFRVVAGSKPRASPSSNFTILHFYLGRPRTLQSRYTSRRLADRIRITVLEYGSGPLPCLGRSRSLRHSRYTSRRLADRIRIQRLDRYGLGEGKETVAI